MDRKHCWKRRKCWLPAFSPFLTMFSKLFFSRVIISQDGEVQSSRLFIPHQTKLGGGGVLYWSHPVRPSVQPYVYTRLGGSVVSVSDSWPGGCEFDPRLRRLFFLAYFRLSPLQKHVRKVVGGFERKVVLVLVWESQETHMRHRPPWYDLSC